MHSLLLSTGPARAARRNRDPRAQRRPELLQTARQNVGPFESNAKLSPVLSCGLSSWHPNWALLWFSLNAWSSSLILIPCLHALDFVSVPRLNATNRSVSCCCVSSATDFKKEDGKTDSAKYAWFYTGDIGTW